MALDLHGDVVDLLRDLVDIESVSGDEARITDAVEEALRTQAPHLEVIRHNNNVIARTNLGLPERVVLAGHLDTVPLTDPPNLPARFEGEGSERRIIGRGTCDMKGGVAVQLSVAAAATAPTRDLTLICYEAEEIEATRNGLGHIARDRPELLAGDFAVLGEPTAGRIEGGCQGTVRVRITVPGRAAHSARAWMGHNAIHDAGEVLRRLAAYTPREPIVDGLQYREGLNAVKIVGGIVGNVIPDRCQIDINFRFAPDRSVDEALAHLAEVFEGFSFEVTDRSEGARPGLDRPIAADFLAAVGGEPTAKYGWTDVARFSALGIPAVNYGPADPIHAHTDGEFCPVADVYACRAALLRWLAPDLPQE